MPPKKSYERELGELSTRLDNLASDFKEERHQAAEHRVGLKQTITSLSEAVRVLSQQLVVNEARIEGATAVKKWLTTTLIGFSAAIGAVINEIWKYVTHLIR